MFGLTQLGIIHTAISLVAVFAALISFARDNRIDPDTHPGQVYVWATTLTCITGFGIFQHGGFGKPHVLGIITLLTLGVAYLAGREMLGRASLYIETVCYSTTFFFHMIPAITETSTRLPPSTPLLPNADAPELQMASAALFVLLCIGLVIQIKWQRGGKWRASPLGQPNGHLI